MRCLQAGKSPVIGFPLALGRNHTAYRTITMSKKKTRRVGIWHDLDWGLKREFEVYAGVQEFANEAGWECSIDPVLEHSLLPKSGEPPYDGILGRVTPEIAAAARQADVPMVNVWLNSPVTEVPEVFNDHEAAGVMAAEHLLARGFRQFGYLGYQRLLDSRLELKGIRCHCQPGGEVLTAFGGSLRSD
jgi:DNA-binding LacI/PurR family transcriptional regulator